MHVDDLKGLVLFSSVLLSDISRGISSLTLSIVRDVRIWQADFALAALSVQAAHNLGLHTAMARYLRLEDPHSREGGALMDLSRLYATIYIHDHLSVAFHLVARSIR